MTSSKAHRLPVLTVGGRHAKSLSTACHMWLPGKGCSLPWLAFPGFLEDRISFCTPGWSGTHYVGQHGLELSILLPPPPECWDHGHKPSLQTGSLSLALKVGQFFEKLPPKPQCDSCSEDKFDRGRGGRKLHLKETL